MTLRLPALLLLASLAVVGCSGGDDVPEDQAVRPASAPSGWTATELGPVTVATPAEWAKQPTTRPTSTIESTTWRAAEVDGASAGGMDVRVIDSPQQDARRAAQALAIDAMARLQGGDIEPTEVVWPNAEAAYLLQYTSQVPLGTEPDAPVEPYVTCTLVLDLADGTQVQVTSLVAESVDDALAERAVSTTALAETEEP